MSLKRLNSLLQPEKNIDLTHLKELSKTRQKNVTLIDLDITSNHADARHGIVEIAMLHINPKGQVAWTTGFVNPERSLSPNISQMLGITDDFLLKVPNWKEGWAQALSHVAKNHIVVGFGVVDYVLPVIQSQHERYGEVIPVFNDVIDVRSLYCFHKHKRAKLSDLAQYYSVALAEKHRVQNDVAAIAVMAEKMVGEYGTKLWDDKHRTWSTALLAPSGFTSPEDAVGYNPNENGIGNSEVQAARTLVVKALAESKTVREFITNLEKDAFVRVPVKFGKVLGYSMVINDCKIKGSDIGDEYTLANLIKTKKLAANPKEDAAYFSERNENHSSDSPTVS